MEDILILDGLSIEHQTTPMGIDVKVPRFGWKLKSALRGVQQKAY